MRVLASPECRERSTELRRSPNAITETAREKNGEPAALVYVDSTLNT